MQKAGKLLLFHSYENVTIPVFLYQSAPRKLQKNIFLIMCQYILMIVFEIGVATLLITGNFIFLFFFVVAIISSPSLHIIYFIYASVAIIIFKYLFGFILTLNDHWCYKYGNVAVARISKWEINNEMLYRKRIISAEYSYNAIDNKNENLIMFGHLYFISPADDFPKTEHLFYLRKELVRNGNIGSSVDPPFLLEEDLVEEGSQFIVLYNPRNPQKHIQFMDID